MDKINKEMLQRGGIFDMARKELRRNKVSRSDDHVSQYKIINERSYRYQIDNLFSMLSNGVRAKPKPVVQQDVPMAAPIEDELLNDQKRLALQYSQQ